MLVTKSTPKVLRCTQATASTHYSAELIQSAPTLIELQDIDADNITIIENSEDSFQAPRHTFSISPTIQTPSHPSGLNPHPPNHCFIGYTYRVPLTRSIHL